MLSTSDLCPKPLVGSCSKRIWTEKMNLEAQLRDLIDKDPVQMHFLRMVRDLNLPDRWVASGFVRSLVWDIG
jgi:Uncharacterized protein conserved in bacteria